MRKIISCILLNYNQLINRVNRIKPVNRFLWVISILTVLGIAFAIFKFFEFFGNTSYSYDIAQWGQFGDFFGGILNPFISLISLIILGYLTYIVNRESGNNNIALFKLEKKMEAFDQLMNYHQYLSKTERVLVPDIKKHLDIYNRDVWAKIDPELLKRIKDFYYYFIDVNYYIQSFNLRYSHLFKYNFKSTDFSYLRDKFSYLNKYFLLMLDLNQFKNEIPPDFWEKYTSTISEYSNFLRDLREELIN